MARLALLVLLAFLACAGQGGGGGRDSPLAVVEALYLETRSLADQLDVTRARGVDTSIHGASPERLVEVLGIRSHPEWSWWAMRGQLVNSPGYMLNYALGAMLVAQLRDRIRAERGDPALGDPGWYPWVADRLFVFGLERPTTRVVADFLGAPLGPQALLRDVVRARPHPAH